MWVVFGMGFHTFANAPLYISDCGTVELATSAALAPYCDAALAISTGTEADRQGGQNQDSTHMAHNGNVILLLLLLLLLLLGWVVSPCARVVGVHFQTNKARVSIGVVFTAVVVGVVGVVAG